MPKIFQPETFTLSNGIPVILQHTDSQVAATYWWVKTGSVDESPTETGFAHFLEHMLFKDASAKETGRASTGQMAQSIESLGGSINAYTSFDQTVYHVTCAATHWEKVIDAFGTIAKPQKFLKTDFDREREVILEELRKNEDSPGRQVFQSLFSQTFKKHPYGRPVIGYIKVLKAAKVAQLEAFYRRNYVSEKMGLILVGPVQDQTGARKKAIVRYLEKHFGAKVIKKQGAKPRSLPQEPALRPAPALLSRAFDVKTPTLSLSFRVPEQMHPDVPALDLLAGILGMGELSRLYQKLFQQDSLVTEVSGGIYIPSDPGMLYFQAEFESLERLNIVTEAVFKELRRFADEGPTQDELSRVIVNAESERLYATQSADGMAGRLGFLGFILNDMGFDQKYLEQLRSVDPARVQEVAREYLDYHRMSAVVMVPKANAKHDVSSVGELAKKYLDFSTVKPSKRSLVHSSKVGEPTFFDLPSGIRVAYLERPSSHVFSIHSAVMGGTRLESAENGGGGASNLMSMSWTKGTSIRDARTIAGITEGHAASVDGYSGRNSVGLQMTGLARDWGKLSELFTDVLLDPIFPDSEVEHSRRVTEDSIRGLEDHSSQVCSKLFLQTLFEHHPYGKITIGTLESVAKINSKTLRDLHRSWIRPERMVISLSGPMSRPALDLWLKEVAGRAQSIAVKNGASPKALDLQDEPSLKAPRWVEKKLGREQTHIIVGGLGSRIISEERFAIRMMQTLLGGQSGRLFIELREKKSLAYTVDPISFEGIERGYIGTYIACAPSKKDEALAGIRAVLEKLAEKGPTSSEMNRAKEFYLGRRAMDLQGDSSLAAHAGLELLYRIPFASESEIEKRIRAVTPKQIQDVCRKYLVEPYMVTSVVG